MTQPRKMRFWFDQAGSLTEFTNDVNSAALERAVEILENTGLNDDDESILPGIRSATLPLNGYYNDVTANSTTPGIIDTLDAAQGTGVSSTWQLGIGDDYFFGEGYLDGLAISGDGKALVTWSCGLRVDGAVTKTSVQQT